MTIAVSLFVVSAVTAGGDNKQVVRAIQGYFANYKPWNLRLKNCGLERKRGNIVVGRKRITLYTNKNFGSQVFTPELVDSIYDGIKESLPIFITQSAFSFFSTPCSSCTASSSILI